MIRCCAFIIPLHEEMKAYVQFFSSITYGICYVNIDLTLIPCTAQYNPLLKPIACLVTEVNNLQPQKIIAEKSLKCE